MDKQIRLLTSHNGIKLRGDIKRRTTKKHSHSCRRLGRDVALAFELISTTGRIWPSNEN
jgi:hypothetical protein